ncbi:hypothetical protein [Calothrix sp. 336/3]|uniref:hypothetical protein n=1 Tax=Calothrix sp. 336/3 TaxID=1337936 RepID=UPI0004E3E012|nr:hypothetical protein [Calothrix sp. 336/3]AKG23004.1 hypothetical protein IJ00_18500 [Calothrix sp. 336/3]
MLSHKQVVPSILLLTSISAGSAIAASENPSLTIPTPKVCKLAQIAQAEDPKGFEDGKIVGTVYSVVGDVVSLELEDGTIRHTGLSRQERAHIGQIVGRKVVITDIPCNRVKLAPYPIPVSKPIEVPKVEPAPAPAPIETPAPAPAPIETPAPAPIPQTW